MKILKLTVLFMLALSTLALANDPLPFAVKLGDQAAQRKEGVDTHAVFAGPVASNAVMSVSGVEGQIIVNIFPAHEDGTVDSGAQALILLFDAKASKAINQNMQGKAPAAGWYLANVVGGGNTSRIVFQVK